MSLLIFFIVLIILILSHEFGHFISAKINEVRVEEFGFGFPPRLFGFKYGETLYSLNLIPFGGFVKIFGEDNNDKIPKSFSSKPIYSRAFILAAGVLFNIILAWPFLTAGFLVGAPISFESSNDFSPKVLIDKGIMILQVQDKTPAEAVGLKGGDRILRLWKNNEMLDVSSVSQVQDFIAKYRGVEIGIEYLRGEEKLSAKVVPLLNPPAEKGALGIIMDHVAIVKLSFFGAVWAGFKATLDLTAFVAQNLIGFFKSLFMGSGAALGQVIGPVGIVGLVGDTANSGFIYLIQLIALLSINLAFINLFPFPALDGGRLLFLVVEFIKGSPVSQKISNIANNIGFAILVLLMLIVTYKDIFKILQ